MNAELRAKLMKAQSLEEVTELLKEDGQDGTQAEQIWTELTHKRQADGKELSLDELEAVSGGYDRDWATEGCAATVRPGTPCWSNDNCNIWDVVYTHYPSRFKCAKCGTYLYSNFDFECPESNTPCYKYVCKNCGYWEYHYIDDAGRVHSHA